MFFSQRQFLQKAELKAELKAVRQHTARAGGISSVLEGRSGWLSAGATTGIDS